MYTTRKTILLATACALMAAPAFAASTNSNPGSPMSAKQLNKMETTGAAPSGSAAISTQDFVNKAAQTNMFEVQAGQLAEQKDQRQPDQKFAKRMVKDHSKAGDQLKSLVDSGKVEAQLPASLDEAHQQKLDHLQTLSGKQFDKAYDEAQKQGHKDAIATFQNYARDGHNAALKQWAQKTLPTLKEHLSMAKKLNG